MTYLSKFTLLVALLIAPLAVSAQDEGPRAAAAGDLRIVHLWSTDPEGFVEAWGSPTPPTLQTTLSTVRSVPIQQFILYANCARDADDRCHLSASVTITAPDGSPYGEVMEFAALPPEALPVPRDRIGLTPVSIGILVEDDEQVGTYIVELAVTDVNSGLTAVDIVEIEVGEE